jgi:glucosamine-6-phosphate deaminase
MRAGHHHPHALYSRIRKEEKEIGKLVRETTVGKMRVLVYDSRASMGEAAAKAVAEGIRQYVKTQGRVHMVFAAAPSQNEFLAALIKEPDVDWTKVYAFHLDEYIGLPENASQRFAKFLQERLFNLLPFKEVHYLDGNAPNVEAEISRYSRLLAEHPLDIACIGIGENGHLAFNDPPVANFRDPVLVKKVELESRCREQQVHDGCFERLELVPTHALTLTIPAIMSAKEIHCIVPGPTKTQAVRDTLYGPISEECPASILRTHDRAVLYLDTEAAG